jgi:hypothetical protein
MYFGRSAPGCGYGLLMSDENPETRIEEAKSDADEDLGELENDAADLEERIDENESMDDEVEVPDPDGGDALSV